MSSSQETRDAIQFWAFVLVAAVACIYVGRSVTSSSSPVLLLVGAGAAGVALATFASPKFGMTMVVLSMIFSPRVQGGSAIFKANDLLLFVIFFTWLARTAIFKGTAFLVKTPINLPILVLSAVFVVSTLLAILRGGLYGYLRPCFYVIKYLEYYLLFFMTVNVIDSRDDVHRYLRYIWLTAVLVTLFGWGQVPSGQRVTAPFDNVIGSQSDSSTNSEPNTFGGYYLVVFGLLLGHFTQTEGTLPLVMLGSLLFMLPPFLLTQSRSSYLGFLAALLFHIFSTRRRQLVLLFGMGMGVILVMSVPRLRDTVVQRVEYTFGLHGDVKGTVTIGDEKVKLEGSTMARVQNWQNIFSNYFPQHPIMGSGVTGVGLVDSYYPRLVGETGLVGLVCFFWLMSRIWNCAWELFRLSNRKEDKALALGVLTGLVGILLHALGSNTFIIVRIMEPFWFTTALMVRVYVDEVSSRPERSEPTALARQAV